jgi:HAD superfamily hydrolase (TIGR01509 family)
MKEKTVIRGLIFDCDDLMFDSELPAYQFWQAICEEHGCSLPLETWSGCIGGSTTDFDPWQYLEAQSHRPVNRDEVQARIQALDTELVTSLPLLAGVLDYLKEAKRLGLKLGVASNSDRPWVLGLLTQQGITTYFDSLMCRKEGVQPKPHPELYQRVLAAIQGQPEEAVALEDSPNGIRAAKAAGLFCVAVPTALSRQLLLDHADMRLTSLQEMPLASLLASVQACKRER